jgi:hypothetical protein
MLEAANFCERVRNLFSWKYPQRSLLLLWALLVLIAVSQLPIRYFLMVGILLFALKKHKAQKNMLDRNSRLAFSFLRFVLTATNSEYVLNIKNKELKFDLSKDEKMVFYGRLAG